MFLKICGNFGNTFAINTKNNFFPTSSDLEGRDLDQNPVI
jgi:hypothetical protein